MTNEDKRYLNPEDLSQRRYPILGKIYDEALHDMERNLDGPKNRIIAIKVDMKKDRTALYWQLSRISTSIDELFTGQDGEPINSGAFVSGIFVFRAMELNAEHKGLILPGEITTEHIGNHNANNKGLRFEERWQQVNEAEPAMDERLTRLFGLLGKPDCLESRMGAVDMYELFREQNARQQFDINDTFQY